MLVRIDTNAEALATTRRVRNTNHYARTKLNTMKRGNSHEQRSIVAADIFYLAGCWYRTMHSINTVPAR